jgi:hypothetical protein
MVDLLVSLNLPHFLFTPPVSPLTCEGVERVRPFTSTCVKGRSRRSRRSRPKTWCTVAVLPVGFLFLFYPGVRVYIYVYIQAALALASSLTGAGEARDVEAAPGRGGARGLIDGGCVCR